MRCYALFQTEHNIHEEITIATPQQIFQYHIYQQYVHNILTDHMNLFHFMANKFKIYKNREDYIQEAYLHLYEQFQYYDKDRSSKITFLYKTLQSFTIKYIKSEKNEKNLLYFDEEISITIDRGECDDIDFDFSRLSEFEYAVVHSYYYDNLKQKEIARNNNCTQQHIQKVLKEAISKIRYDQS